jgi:hypothetical protein
LSILSESEFGTVELGDKCLTKRLHEFSDRLMASPESSVQSASRGWDETMGANRFLNNTSVKPEVLEKEG